MQNNFTKNWLASLFIFISTGLLGQELCKPVGWVTENGGVTGGGNVTPIFVKSISELKTAAGAEGAKVIFVQGDMGSFNASDRIDVASDKTIFGMPGATIKGGFDVKRSSNVIIRNLKIQGPGAVDVNGVDCILIDNSTNVWLDHLDVSDGQDGNLDVVNGSNFITISWTKFSYSSISENHMFSNLLGNSDDKISDRGKIKVTMQYNWYAQGVLERMPRVRFGQVHIVNNLFASKGNNQCIRAGFEADLLIEGNVFKEVKLPIDLYERDFTAVTVRNNSFIKTTGNTLGSGTSFVPPYTLEIADTSDVETLVMAGAGATLTTQDCGIITSQLPYQEEVLRVIPLYYGNQYEITSNSDVTLWTLYDLEGRIIASTEKSRIVDFKPHLNAGVYFLKIELLNGRLFHAKITK